jgi:hypothetical protein
MGKGVFSLWSVHGLYSSDVSRYLGVIFDERITWRLHIEMIEAKAFRTFIRNYSLFKSKRLSANIKLTLHKDLIRSVLTYACPPGNLRQIHIY